MVVGGYLILVLSINLYLLYSLYKFLIDIMLNDLAVKIFAVKSLALIILASVAFGAYLSYQTKKAILFLIATACFGFAAILEYLNSYYSSTLSFLMVDRILYIVGVYFIFRYAIAEAVVDIKKDIMKNKMKPYFNKGVLN
ncbi:hypothetical protein [Neotamlana laminarinivorans]|uniref:Uncharacterized protein n=1 Tax=Neotamlana laminarinivorans TaxID=2883124 RepID=A0A9X1L0G2_9FLAO|nr:hypothetical protein [Tamlana laminarinivorans]MCB4797475.1 hypothetical protein [Tamlana laminarinivorans]